MVPASGLPAALRTSGGSMPWSMQLRITCISGSDSSSTMSLSSSVSAPAMLRPISLPASREILRTTRESLSNTCPSGTMRTSRMPRLQLVELARQRAQLVVQLARELGLRRWSSLTRSRICVSPARAMPSSPTMFMRWSSLRMSTRTVCATDLSDSSSSSRSRRSRRRRRRLGPRLAPPAGAAGANGTAAGALRLLAPGQERHHRAGADDRLLHRAQLRLARRG